MSLMFKKNSLLGTLLTGETTLLRFWLSLWSFSWAIISLTDMHFSVVHQLATAIASTHMLAFLFFINGSALMYGVITKKYNTFLLFLECVLGVFLWAGVGIAETVQYHLLSPGVLAGFTAFYLLIRYPTHYKPGQCGVKRDK